MFTIHRLKTMTTKPELISALDQSNTQVNAPKKLWAKPELILISTNNIEAKTGHFGHEHTVQPFPSKPGVYHYHNVPYIVVPKASKSHMVS